MCVGKSNMKYFVVANDGRRYGPADLTTLREWIGGGRVGPRTTIEDENASRMPAWLVPGLEFAAVSAPPTAEPTPVMPQEELTDWAIGGVEENFAPTEMRGEYYRPVEHIREQDTYLVKNVLHLIFGLLPLSIVAIIYSFRTDAANRNRDLFGAESLSKQAKFWGDLSFVAFLIIAFLSLALPALLQLQNWHK